MAELVDAADSKSAVRKDVSVRFRSRARLNMKPLSALSLARVLLWGLSDPLIYFFPQPVTDGIRIFKKSKQVNTDSQSLILSKYSGATVSNRLYTDIERLY